MTYDGYAIFMPYGWCRGEALKVRKRTLRLSAGVACCAPPIFKPSLGRREIVYLPPKYEGTHCQQDYFLPVV